MPSLKHQNFEHQDDIAVGPSTFLAFITVNLVENLANWDQSTKYDICNNRDLLCFELSPPSQYPVSKESIY